MTKQQLERCKLFLDYWKIPYNEEYIPITDWGNSCIMNKDGGWHDFLGCSLNSVAEVVAKELDKPTKKYDL